MERDVHGAERDARSWSIRDGMPKPTADDAVVRQRRTASTSSARSASCEVVTRRPLDRVVHAAVRVDQTRQDLGPAEVDADDAIRAHICRVT